MAGLRNLALAKESTQKNNAEEPQKGGFFLERRKEAGPSVDDKVAKAETSSLKRFMKYINQCIKAGKRSSKVFSLARINVLEIESIDPGDARQLDDSLKSIVIDFLRKSDRIYSDELGSYLILMPATMRKNAVKALTRITEALSDFSFSQNDFVIRPSSVFTLIPEDTLITRSASELLEELGVIIEDSASKTGSNLDGAADLFTGSTSEWFMRYNYEKEPFLKFHLGGGAKLETYKGFDIWSEHRPILLREFSLKNFDIKTGDNQVTRLVQFFRQMQSLSKSSVSPLCDFHIVEDRIYLVNYIPECDRLISALDTNFIEEQEFHFNDDAFKNVVFKLAGALSYLHSLVPPTVLSDYNNLLVFYNAVDKGRIRDLKILNYDLERLMNLVAGEKQTEKPHENIRGFASYVLNLNEKFFDTPDSQLVELLTRIAGGTPEKKYNSFSKLRSLLKEKAPLKNA